MFLSKKSVLKSLLVIGLLGVPQKAEASPALFMFVFATPIMGVVCLASCIHTFVNSHSTASNIVQNQEDIIHYAAHLTLRSDKDIIQNFESNNPDQLISQIMEYACRYEYKRDAFYLQNFITLQDDKVIKLKDIRIRSKKTDVLREDLIKRFIVPTGFHLTYKPKMAAELLAWPVSVGLMMLSASLP